MITIISKKGLFTHTNEWFASGARKTDALRLISYTQAAGLKNISGLKRESFFTKKIDLTKSEEELLALFCKNTRYEVVRAEKEKITMKLESDLNLFVSFFNQFADSKGLKRLPSGYLEKIAKYLCITKAIFENSVLVMHSYILDKETGRARLLHSASLFRQEHDKKQIQTIGRANRYLHYKDMIHLKSAGMVIYDFGGYAYNTTDKALKGINDFKDGFGGILVEESNYISFLLLLFQKTQSLIK